MSEPQSSFDKAMALIDAANSEDPNQLTLDGRDWPKELLYSHRMSDMLERYRPDADNAIRLAVRAQHIQRWQSKRDSYPMNRIGYLQWRKDLYKFHAQKAADILAQAGSSQELISRVEEAVAKKRIKENPDTQLLEDVADLVFIEHYLQEFATKHPEYNEQKWLDIIQKTWKKMSYQAHQFVLADGVKLPQSLIPLIQKGIGQS